MPRPPERPEGPRTTSVRLALTSKEKAVLVLASQRAELPLVKWIRRALERAARFEQATGGHDGIEK